MAVHQGSTYEGDDPSVSSAGQGAVTAEAEPGALLDLVLAPGNDPWTEEIVRAVAEVSRRAGVEVVVSTASGAIEDVDRWVRSMRARGTRGVILVNSDSAHTIQDGVTRDVGLDVPLVVVDPSGGTAADVAMVGPTNWLGAVAAVGHLVDVGHRRIGCITGPLSMRHSGDRVQGYRAALEAGRIEVDESLIIEVDRLLVEGDLGQVCGGRAARALLDREDPPTAIFACDDHLALGALEAVPTDYSSPRAVSVVGFDDLPYTMFNLPLLTTIGQPVREMAMYATRMVLNHVPGTPLPAERVEFPTEFVLRETAHGPIPSTAD